MGLTVHIGCSYSAHILAARFKAEAGHSGYMDMATVSDMVREAHVSPGLARTSRLAGALEASGHRLLKLRSWSQCVRCELVRKTWSAAWLIKNPCPGPKATSSSSGPEKVEVVQPQETMQIGSVMTEPSHVLASHRGLVWCWLCGARATHVLGTKSHVVHLAAPCKGRRSTEFLSRVRKGLTPTPKGEWPLPADGTLLPLEPCP